MTKLPRLSVLGILVLLSSSAFAAGEATPDPSAFPLVYVELPESALDQLPPDPNRTLRSDICEGGRLIFQDGSGVKKLLSEGFHSACEPDVSVDGKKVLFSGKRAAGDFWDIWEIQSDGSGLTQITSEVGNCRFPIYLSTYYVITASEPWPLILFVSELAGQLNEIGALPGWDFYSCRTDGSEIRQVTFGPSSELDPFLAWDGRVLYSTWQRGLPHFGPNGRSRIFNMNLDGTDLQAFTGSQGKRVQHSPTVTTSDLAVFVESDDVVPDGGGQLAAVALRRNLHSYRSLSSPADGHFHSPSPLPDGSILVSRRAGGTTGPYEVVRFDITRKALELVASEPSRHLVYAQWVGVRRQPDGRSSVVNEGSRTGQIYCLDVGISDTGLPVPEMRKAAKRVRIAEGLPRIASEEIPPESRLLPKRLLGELPIEPDGSFFAEIPANVPIQIQLLDEDGLALKTCDWIWVRNKEPRGCIGCHEDGELVPANRHVDAVKKPPVRLVLSPGRRRSVDFNRDVLPLVAKSCTAANCHAGGSTAPDLSPPSGGVADPAYSQRVYQLLTTSELEGKGTWVNPGEARTSPLVWHMLGRSTSRPWDRMAAHRPTSRGTARVSPEVAARIAEWIDLGAHGGEEVADAIRRWTEYFGGDE